MAVIHQRISQLNSSGLMNIESSHKFTRSGDTASGCIEGVNLEDRQVGVVEGRQVMQGIFSMIFITRNELTHKSKISTLIHLCPW